MHLVKILDFLLLLLFIFFCLFYFIYIFFALYLHYFFLFFSSSFFFLLFFFLFWKTYVVKHCPATAMQIGDEASSSIILVDGALLVKMFITLVQHDIFCSNFVYLWILTLSSHWYEKMWWGFTEHHFGRSSSFGENAHYSWTGWYIWLKFCQGWENGGI